MTLFSMLAYQPNVFLAFSLPLPSHHPFPSCLVVGPHRSLLSPGPLVTNKQTILSQCETLLEVESLALSSIQSNVHTNLLAPVTLLKRALTTHDTIVRKVALLGTLLTHIEPCSFTLVRRTHGA